MIIRIFRATAVTGSEAELDRMLGDASVTLLQAQEGLLGYFAGRPLGEHDFVMISLWRDREAVEGFAGPDPAQAVIPEEEVAVIERWWVEHYDAIASKPEL